MAINYILKFGKVISIKDEEDGDRIRVHVRGEDPTSYKTEEIPYAFPLLPKHLFIKPKVGESVFVITQSGNASDERFYIGPIISQPDKLSSDIIAPDAFLKGGPIAPGIAPSTIPENRGLQPDPNDIGILGRGSTDIIQKKDEVRIRAGKSKDLKKLNNANQTYVQIKHDMSTGDGEGQINIVSDKINLLSHKSKKKFNLNDPEKLITDKEFQKILKEAQQMVLGNKLVEYLELKRKFDTTHVHPYPGMAPDLDQIEAKNYLNFDINSILSENIRLN